MIEFAVCQPNVFWVKPKRYLQSHPTGQDALLAIEVADSSLRSDRTTKADLYAEAGIQSIGWSMFRASAST